MRHSATRSLLTRSDVLIVASASCVYGLGSPEAYQDLLLSLETGQEIPREAVPGTIGLHALRAQRHRFSPRHISGPGRRGRGLSGL